MSSPVRCPACGREILFALSPAGKNLPLERIANYYTIERHEDRDVAVSHGVGWVNHYSTCADPEKFRARDRSMDPISVVRTADLATENANLRRWIENGGLDEETVDRIATAGRVS